jgi:hypothetical protein
MTAHAMASEFNAERFRTADDKIIVLEGVEDGGQLWERLAGTQTRPDR